MRMTQDDQPQTTPPTQPGERPAEPTPEEE